MKANTQITVSFVKNVSDTKPKQRQLSIDDFWAMLSRPEVRGNLPLAEYLKVQDKTQRTKLRDGYGVIPGKFKNGKGRTDDNLDLLHLFPVDVDNEGNSRFSLDDAAERLAGIRAFIHTSYSNTTENERYRAYLTLSRPITTDEYKRLWSIVNEKYFNGALDPSGKGSSHLYFLPSCPPDAIHLFRCGCVEGQPLDVDALLATEAQPKEEPLIDLGGKVPHRLVELLNRHEMFRKRYLDGNTSGLNDTSRSGRDYAVAGFLIRQGWYDDEIAAALWNYQHGKARERGGEYIADILRKMRKKHPAPSSQIDKPAFRFIHISELEVREREWLIEDLIEVNSLCSIFGDIETFKSFWLIAMACCIATGTSFYGQEVRQGAVFLVVGEGHAGITRRIRAWEIRNGVSTQGSPLYISEAAAGLCEPDSSIAVKSAIDTLAEMSGVEPTFIGIDTLARNFGAGNENDTADMNSFVASVDHIRRPWQATAVITHHVGHGDKTRSRGAITFKAALDFEYRTTRTDNQLTVENTKVKEGESPLPLAYRICPVDLGFTDKKGRPVTSAVLDSIDYKEPKVQTRDRILQILAAKPGITKKAVADELNIKPPSVGQQIKKMEEQGLLNGMKLTELGRTCLHDIEHRGDDEPF